MDAARGEVRRIDAVGGETYTAEVSTYQSLENWSQSAVFHVGDGRNACSRRGGASCWHGEPYAFDNWTLVGRTSSKANKTIVP